MPPKEDYQLAQRMRKKHIIYLSLYALAVTAVAGIMTYNTVTLLDVIASTPDTVTPNDPYDAYLDEIEQREDFKEWVDLEKRSIYWTEQKQKAEFELQQIEQEKLENEQVRADKLRNYFAKRNPELVPYADEVAELPRWLDVVAIAHAETGLCTAGVGESRNNCGAIKNPQTGEFKRYANEYDALWDINYLLHEEHMAGKTIDEINGTYCYQEDGVNGKCDGWTERIKAEKQVVLNS